jgi:TrmH family RNA methyltransferase
MVDYLNMITSVRNQKIQQLRGLQARAKNRREAGAFVVEGVRLAEEALVSGWQVRSAFYTDDLRDRGDAILSKLKKVGVAPESVSEEVMKALSDTETPQGILLELGLRELPVPAQLDLVLILDGVADPGNLGTLLRSAASAAVGAVLLGPASADPFSPKVLRSAMGAHFRLPIRSLQWPEIAKFCRGNGLQIFLAEAGDGQAYDRVDLTQPSAFIVGGEAHGVSAAAKDLQPTSIQIPMPGQTESLNAAMAGTLLLFETLRQRRAKS